MKHPHPWFARIVAAVLIVAAVAVDVGPARAATLLTVHADLAPGRDPRATLTFNGGVPTYRIYGNGTNDVSLMLVGTSRAPNTAASITGRNSLKSISIDSLGDNAEVTFHDAGPVTLNVTVGSGQSLVATLAAAQNAPAASFGAQPEAAPTPPPAAVAAPGTEMEVVPLKYADVSEIVGLLVAGQQIPSNDTFVPQSQNFGSSGLSGGFGGIGGFSGSPIGSSSTVAQPGSGNGASLGQQINENIGIDRRLNAVVLTGPPDLIERLKAKIAKLDVPLPSVALETQIVELTDTAAKDAGIDLSAGGGPSISATYQIKNLATGSGTVNLQAAVYAQVSKGQGKVIARPSIVAQNGAAAQIITGDALPIVTSIAVSGVNAVSQQVQYVNVGVSLQIQPRISSDGFVTSHVYAEVSSVTGYQQGYPTLSQREATTSATVKDGQPFVIGGLLQQNEISNLSRVPGIGDLPLIGSLFRVRHDQRQSTNLYIIVVPHILTNGSPVPPGLPNHEGPSG
ncbi:MAG TPA: secretin N-terminal domain-containing protein [Candidatus Acidoferrum sp.]|nr:secretin N-terminal domain-containing protein [Candidatus Acidoferrum sp.]